MARPTVRQPQASAIHARHEFQSCCASGSTRRAATNALSLLSPTPLPRSATRGRGWLGIKFQVHPHVNLHHNHHVRARQGRRPPAETLGMIGVNLILRRVLPARRADEIDRLAHDGLFQRACRGGHDQMLRPAFTGVDTACSRLQLVEQWLTEAPCSRLMPRPSSRRNCSGKTRSARTRQFPSAYQSHARYARTRAEQFVQDKSLQDDPPVVMFEMTLRQLQVDNCIDHQDFLDRVDTLGALGKPVLIPIFSATHRLVNYLARQTDKPIGLAHRSRASARRLDENFTPTFPAASWNPLASCSRMARNSTSSLAG